MSRAIGLKSIPRAVVFATATTAIAACGNAPEPSDSLEQSSSAIRCTDPDGCPSRSTCSLATGTLTAGASTIPQGQSTTLSWSASVPDDCGEQLLLNGVPVAPSGSITVSPITTVTYALRVGPKMIARAKVNVDLPDVVYIDGSSGEWPALLVQAVGRPHTRVVLGADVDMDLTFFDGIAIADNVTLTSEAPPPKSAIGKVPPAKGGKGRGRFGPQPPLRDGRHLGPRLFTTSRPHALFVASCQPGNYESNNIHILGFRIEGPDFDSMEGDDKLERAIQIDSCLGVEIADMEISGWSGAAVYVADGYSRQLGPDTVQIHDNFIHHNQHVGGNGYGVDFSAGAYGTVERNVFDFNRHAVTSSGKPGTGYTADRNLILKGGGRHDRFYNTWTHLMDIHGDANCLFDTDSSWLCGNAGDQFFMTNNAFQYTHDYDIKIRGTPVIGVNIFGNVFPQGDGDSIDTTQGFTNINVGPNTYNVDTFGEYGVCDFDGDGKDDLFLATGASWWTMSSAKMHWVFLAPYTERLKDVRLGDFNGDKRCDVIAKNSSTNLLEMASGGSGAWTTVPGDLNDPLEKIRVGDFNGDGISDLFFRGDDGQWWAISPGHYGWTALQSSSTELDDLKLGDFNGDGITDVLGKNGGTWAISWSARSSWQPASGLSDDLSKLFIANVDGLPGDDVVRYTATSYTNGRWDVSSGARTGWSTLASVSFPATADTADVCMRVPAYCATTYFGRFDDFPGADVLTLDRNTRTSRIFSKGHTNFGDHGLYTY